MNKVFSHSYSDLTIDTQFRKLVIGVIIHPIGVHMYLDVLSTGDGSRENLKYLWESLFMIM